MKTEIIAYFSAAGVFRKKTPETQRKAFDDCSDDFRAEFDRELSDDDWQTLLDYQAEKFEAKRKREAAKIARDADKAAKLAAKPVASAQDSATAHIEKYPAGKYILTVAQNNTDVDATFFASLQEYAKLHGATILVAQTTYNKSAFRQPGLDESDDLWFDPMIKPYLVRGHIDLDGTHFIADANVIVTTKWPTSGFDGITPSGVNAIIPASKIELRVSAALKNTNKTKVIASTGTVTKRNYILRKAGAQAGFAHSIGALFVDTVNNTLRHLEQVDGATGFYDVDGYYSPLGFISGADVAALQLGDVHAEKMTWENKKRALDLIATLRPDNLILHDVLDFSSRNHHNIKDPIFIHAQHIARNTVEKDLQNVAKVIQTFAEYAKNVVIIESNHDLALTTWLKNADFKLDPTNAIVYLDCMLAQYRATEQGNKAFNLLEYACNNIGTLTNDNVHFHKTDESVIIAGVEMGNHGHNGANGARGNPKGFANLGIAMNTGHTHSPSIYGPCYTAGVAASLEMGYNVGPSSWAIADIVTYENGQRQILFA